MSVKLMPPQSAKLKLAPVVAVTSALSIIDLKSISHQRNRISFQLRPMRHRLVERSC
jgi:hypothetical protein